MSELYGCRVELRDGSWLEPITILAQDVDDALGLAEARYKDESVLAIRVIVLRPEDYEFFGRSLTDGRGCVLHKNYVWTEPKWLSDIVKDGVWFSRVY